MNSNQWLRNGLIYLLILVAVSALFFQVAQQPKQPNTIPISKLAQSVQAGTVKKISVNGNALTITYKEGGPQETALKSNRDIGVEETLKNLGVPADKIAAVDIVYEQPPQWGNILTLARHVPAADLRRRAVLLLDAPSAERQQSSAVVWQIARADVLRRQTDGDVCGRGRRGRGQSKNCKKWSSF